MGIFQKKKIFKIIQERFSSYSALNILNIFINVHAISNHSHLDYAEVQLLSLSNAVHAADYYDLRGCLPHTAVTPLAVTGAWEGEGRGR